MSETRETPPTPPAWTEAAFLLLAAQDQAQDPALPGWRPLDWWEAVIATAEELATAEGSPTITAQHVTRALQAHTQEENTSSA